MLTLGTIFPQSHVTDICCNIWIILVNIVSRWHTTSATPKITLNWNRSCNSPITHTPSHIKMEETRTKIEGYVMWSKASVLYSRRASLEFLCFFFFFCFKAGVLKGRRLSEESPALHQNEKTTNFSTTTQQSTKIEHKKNSKRDLRSATESGKQKHGNKRMPIAEAEVGSWPVNGTS